MKSIQDVQVRPSIALPQVKNLWLIGLPGGLLVWMVGVSLWRQAGLDRAVLLYFNAARLAQDPMILLSEWLTNYGMAVITAILIVYFLLALILKPLNAPKSIYLYTICSLGISGVAGDLIKELLLRPRPLEQFGDQILVLSQSLTPAFPSGHSVKSIALILPFLLLVANSHPIHKAIKAAFLLIAAGVCLSRVVLGAHFVSDVIAGVGLAWIVLPVSMAFANMILKQTSLEQLPKLATVWAVLLVFLTYIFMGL